MPNESQNVLVGVASLAIRQPNDALAMWSTTQKYAGNRSAKLYKSGSGNAGSTHLEALFPDSSIDVDAFLADPTDYSFWYWYSAVTGNFVQFELKFEDPNSDGWMEVTVMVHQTTLGDGPTMGWRQKALALTDAIGYGGVNETGESFFDYDLGDTIAEVVSGPAGQAAAPVVGDWKLRRIRLELWESEPERTAYVDSLEVDGTVYTVEPGGTLPGMSLSSPYTDAGYTEDGVNINYSVEMTMIRVEEETYPVNARIGSETLEIVCNMAESSLYNIDKAIAGSVLSGNILTLGAGVVKEMSIKLTGKTPGGFIRSYEFPRVVATGAVGMSYRRAEKTIVPLTLTALKPRGEPVGTFVDNAV